MDNISIIIPAYNAEQWLERCLGSVVRACDPDCEIIIIDDGSTDMTTSVAKDFAAAHRSIPIHVHSIRHSGPTIARRVGFNASVGQWIYFVDSDDFVPADAIRQLRELVEDDVDMICGNILVRHASNTEMKYTGVLEEMDSDELTRRLLEGKIRSTMHGKLIRRSLFDQYQWDDDLKLVNHEDELVAIKLAKQIKKRVLLVPSLHAYTYVLRGGSQSSLLHLTIEGVECVWTKLKNLDLPTEPLTKWGLDMLYRSFISRGVAFENDYTPALDLREMASDLKLDREYRYKARLLRSKRMRQRVMRKHVRDGMLTTAEPHMAFAIYCHNSIHGVETSVKSIFNTGFRNIEILIVNDGSDHETSVKLNALQVKYRRVHIIKNPETIGPNRSRLGIINKCRAFALMFLRPGDRVRREGIYQALLAIDRGADFVLMGAANYSTLFGTTSEYILPATMLGSSEDINERALKSLLNRYTVSSAMNAVVVRRDFMSKDDVLPLTDGPTHYGGEMLTRLSLSVRDGNVCAIDEIGYICQCSPRNYLKHETRWKHASELTRAVFEFLAECDRVDLFGDALEGLNYGIAHGIACRMSNPFYCKRKIRQTVENTLSVPQVRELYHTAGLSVPTTDEIIAYGRRLIKNHRGQYLRYWLMCH